MARPSTAGLIRGQVCRRGHDDWSLRASGKYVCKPCKRANVEENRRLAQEDEMKPRLPVDPLIAEVERRIEAGRAIRRATGGRVEAGPASERELFGAVGDSYTAAARSYGRAKYRGYVTLDALDDICVYLDCHPREIYGDAYDTEALGGVLPPDFMRTDWVPRDIVALVRARLAEPKDDPWWWHIGRRGPIRASARL